MDIYSPSVSLGTFGHYRAPMVPRPTYSGGSFPKVPEFNAQAVPAPHSLLENPREPLDLSVSRRRIGDPNF